MKKLIFLISIFVSTNVFAGNIVLKSYYGVNGIEKVTDVKENKTTIDFYYFWKDQKKVSVCSFNKESLRKQGINPDAEELKTKLVEQSGILVVDTQLSSRRIDDRIATLIEIPTVDQALDEFEDML